MLRALLQKRADLVKEGDALFAAATAENRALNATEAKRDDEISAELTSLSADIERAQRHQERQRSVGAPVDANVLADAAAAAARGGERRFATLGEQMMAIALAGSPSRQVDARLQWVGGGMAAGPTGMSEGVSSDGGFLVQTDYSSELLQNMYSGGEIAPRVRRIPISTGANGIAINGVDETSRANGSRWGGIQAYWSGEASLYTGSQPKFRRIKMELDKLTGLCYATEELLQDSTALQSWLMQAFSDEFQFKLEDAIVQGTGSGAPLGFLNSGAVITVSKEASQGAATVVAENILKMWSRMPSRMRKNAIWLINQDVEPQLYQLNVKVKNVAGTENVGGIDVPSVVFIPPGTNGSEYGLLMGRPVVPVEYAATLGTAGDIMLVDLSQYLMIDKNAMQAQSSIHVRFLYDETAFKFTYRANGQPIWQTAMTPYKGTNTQSPFVVLQTR